MNEKRGSSQAVIWILIGIALLVFGVLKYKFSNDMAAAKGKLSDAETVRQEQLAFIDQGGKLSKRTSEIRNLITQQKHSIGSTFNAFYNSEMSNALIERLKMPADVGILVARKSSQWSHFVWVPKGEQQNVVLYAKLVSADSPRTQLDLFTQPDHRLEIPLPQEQLTAITQELRDTDSGVEFFWQFGERKPTSIPFEGFSGSGWMSRGVSGNTISSNSLNVAYALYDSNKVAVRRDSSAELLKKGIWNFVSLHSFDLESDEEKKQLQVAVVLQSKGPFYVSAPNKHQYTDRFKLTWDEAKAGYYRVELRSE